MAQDETGGLDKDVEAAGLPHGGLPKNRKEAALVFDRMEAVLQEAGSGLDQVVRVDQYYPTYKAVDHYHVVRRKRLPTIPPSTSMIMQGLPVPGAEMNVQAIAVIPGSGMHPEALSDPAIAGHPTSGYPAALRAGDFVFIPGMTPAAKHGSPSRNGLAEEAQMPPGFLWRGNPIKLETEYIITQKILPALALAGSSAAHVCKAQVYLVHGEDYSAFMEVWNRHFGVSPCALSVIPCANPGIGQSAARIEINVLALRADGATRKQLIAEDEFVGYQGVPAAVRAGDLLFLSGLMAVDENGLVASAEVDARQPYLASPAKSQMRAILTQAERICVMGGTSLANIVRIQQFHTDLHDLLPSLEVWQERLPGAPLPYTAVEVPGQMPAPGVRLIADLWAYAP
jgi:enamine deaminase RidA (YjgF/YER057c/UK114 family)